MTGPKESDQYDDPTMPFVYLNMSKDEYARITEKTILTLLYVYDTHMADFDWLVRANDDTYLVMENMRSFLAHKCPTQKVVYGKVLRYYRHARKYTHGDNRRGFLQGGSGVLMSREAVRLFGAEMRRDPSFCVMLDGTAEDQEMSDCFRKLGVYPGETRDSLNRERFLMDSFAQ